MGRSRRGSRRGRLRAGGDSARAARAGAGAELHQQPVGGDRQGTDAMRRPRLL